MPGSRTSRTEVISGSPSAARGGCARKKPAAPAVDNPARKWRRVCANDIGSLPFSWLCLQLAFELVEEAPIGAVGNDLLRARLDEAGFVHAQSVEPEGVLGVVFAPLVVWVVAQRLQRVIVALCETAVDELPRGSRRIASAQIGGLQDRPQHPLARDRVLAHELAIAGQQTAEILRPRPIQCGVYQHVADLAGAQFLRLGWEAEKGVDLARSEQLDRLQ